MCYRHSSPNPEYDDCILRAMGHWAFQNSIESSIVSFFRLAIALQDLGIFYKNSRDLWETLEIVASRREFLPIITK